MKTDIVLEFEGRQSDEASIRKMAEKAWTDAGNKAADIKSMNLYAQQENKTVYYVINKDFSGNFSI